MRISKQFALIMVSILALACGYAAAAEGEILGKGKEATTGPAAKGAPAGAAAGEGEFLGKGKEVTTGPAAKGAPAGPAATQPATQPKRKKGFWEGNTMLFVMLGGVLLLYIFMGRSKRKQAAKRKDMLASLKKGAKVTTIGGIVGTVIEVRENEVTVKVDETNNSRLRLARWAIRGVGEEAKTESPDEKK
jgi:preprotein translocase subunit YajC